MNTYKKLVVVLLILGFVFMLNQFDAFGLSKVTDTLIQGIKTAAKRVSRVFVKKQDTVNMQEKVAQEFPELEEVEDIPGIQQKAKKKNLSKDLIEQLSKDRVEDAETHHIGSAAQRDVDDHSGRRWRAAVDADGLDAAGHGSVVRSVHPGADLGLSAI